MTESVLLEEIPVGGPGDAPQAPQAPQARESALRVVVRARNVRQAKHSPKRADQQQTWDQQQTQLLRSTWSSLLEAGSAGGSLHSE